MSFVVSNAAETEVNEVTGSWEAIESKYVILAEDELRGFEQNRRVSSSDELKSNQIYFSIKRLMDIFGSLVGIAISAPVMLVASILIWLEDRGPVFFVQTRIGKDGKPFPCLKLRTMIRNADALKAQLLKDNVHGDNRTFKHKNDPRITRVGKWLRKLSIDEFPQFFNVLMGHMSIVGPRPAVESEVALYSKADRVRLQVKPGLTCIWQISGRSTLSFEQQVQLDAKYIDEMCVSKDVEIIAKTIPAMLFCRGAR